MGTHSANKHCLAVSKTVTALSLTSNCSHKKLLTSPFFSTFLCEHLKSSLFANYRNQYGKQDVQAKRSQGAGEDDQVLREGNQSLLCGISEGTFKVPCNSGALMFRRKMLGFCRCLWSHTKAQFFQAYPSGQLNRAEFQTVYIEQFPHGDSEAVYSFLCLLCRLTWESKGPVYFSWCDFSAEPAGTQDVFSRNVLFSSRTKLGTTPIKIFLSAIMSFEACPFQNIWTRIKKSMVWRSKLLS